ncbi:MAG: nitroreductase family protein [Gallicola sp.]|nr:nitroreductase family protein [Gallicola sp.]
MELQELLRKRRSYRGMFTERKVTMEEMRLIIEAAFLAPTGCNLQSSRMIGVLDNEKVKRIAKIYGQEWAATAPSCVVIATKEMYRKDKGPSRHREDFGAAAQSLLLAVENLGLATTWIQGQIENEKGKEIGSLLKVPEEYSVIGYFPIGEAEKETNGPKKMTFEERCFLDEFGKEFK